MRILTRHRFRLLAIIVAITAGSFIDLAEAAPIDSEVSTILVRMVPSADDAECHALFDRLGAKIRFEYHLVPGLFCLEIDGDLNHALMVCHAESDLVRYAHADQLVTLDAFPTDPLYGSNQYNLNNTGQLIVADRVNIPGADINAEAGWDIFTGDPNLIVAIIDTAIDIHHPDLAANIWTNPGESGPDGMGGDKETNGIDDDMNGFIDDVHGWDFANGDNDVANVADGTFHGTATSSMVGAIVNNGIGVSGVCWDVQIMPLEFLGAQGGTLGGAVAALEYACDHGAMISSNSFGFDGFDQALRDAIEAAGALGHLYVSGAGNGAMPETNYPTLYVLDNILSVAALNGRDWLTGFANFNQISVDLGAQAHFVAFASTNGAGTQSYFLGSGASFAGPQVAAAAALLWGLNPGMTMHEVRERILCSARFAPALDGQLLTGGVLDLGRLLSADVLPPQLDILRPLPDFIKPGDLQTLTFRLASCDVTLDPATALLHWSVDGGSESTAPVIDVGEDYFQADLLVNSCGNEVNFYLTVEDTMGTEYSLPAGAPANTFGAELGVLVNRFIDDFESDTGWTVGDPGDLATTGIWERTTPEATRDGWNLPLQPAGAFSGSMCLVTGGPQGANWFSNDVDGGRTTVTSPVIDVSGAAKLRVSYARWFVNDGGPNPHTKSLVIEFSDDGGANWHDAETVGPDSYEASGRWWTTTIRADQVITPTSQFQMRIIADDTAPGAVVEALIDGIRIAELICVEPGCPGDANGDGMVNFGDVTTVLGNWLANYSPLSGPGDANNDGFVNFNDVTAVLGNWQNPCL